MGVPTFHIRELIKNGKLLAFSSNYALYTDLSARVITKLEQPGPAVEVYPIDEAFLDLTDATNCVVLPRSVSKCRARFSSECIIQYIALDTKEFDGFNNL